MKDKYTLNEVVNIISVNKLKRDDYKSLYENYETKINKNGYLQFRLTNKDSWKNVHTLINKYFNLEEYNKKYKELIETGFEKCLVTHHVNFFENKNKLNNHPDNLQWMGKQEHMLFHTTIDSDNLILKQFGDKIWNSENSEYNKYELQRNRIIKAVTKTINEHNDVYWNGKNNEENRLLQSERMKLKLKEMWEGKNSEDFKEKHQQQLHNLWHGDNSDEFRKKMINVLSNPTIVLIKNKNKVFNIFNKIIENKEQITEESYGKYRYYKNAPFPNTVFGTIDNAIKEYGEYPKRVKI